MPADGLALAVGVGRDVEGRPSWRPLQLADDLLFSFQDLVFGSKVTSSTPSSLFGQVAT